VIVHKARVTLNAIGLRNALYLAQHETDKSIALAPYAVHDFAAIDPDVALEMHAEGRCLLKGMRCLGGSD